MAIGGALGHGGIAVNAADGVAHVQGQCVAVHGSQHRLARSGVMIPGEKGDIHEGVFEHPHPVEDQKEVKVGSDVSRSAQVHLDHVERVVGHRGNDLVGAEFVVLVFIKQIKRAHQLDAALHATANDAAVEFGKRIQFSGERDFGLVHAIDDVVANVKTIEDIDDALAVKEVRDTLGVEAKGQRGLQFDLAANPHEQRRVDRVADAEVNPNLETLRVEDHQVGRLASQQVDHRPQRILEDRKAQCTARFLQRITEISKGIYRVDRHLAWNVNVRQINVDARKRRQARQAEVKVEVRQQIDQADRRQIHVGQRDVDRSEISVDETAVLEVKRRFGRGKVERSPGEILAQRDPVHRGWSEGHRRQEGLDIR